MDTLSASVSSLKVPPPLQQNLKTCHSLYRFKTSPTRPHHAFSTSAKTKTFSHKPPPSLQFSRSTSPLKPKPSSPIIHQHPATGYAAALVDVAHSTNSLHFVHGDVQRLLKLLPSPVAVVEKGNFHRHVVALLKMLLKKNRVRIVKEVLQEFERIYDELCGSQMVLVSSKTKMRKDELFGIAKSVHQFSGAVRVKVRNLVQETVPSFAM